MYEEWRLPKVCRYFHIFFIVTRFFVSHHKYCVCFFFFHYFLEFFSIRIISIGEKIRRLWWWWKYIIVLVECFECIRNIRSVLFGSTFALHPCISSDTFWRGPFIEANSMHLCLCECSNCKSSSWRTTSIDWWRIGCFFSSWIQLNIWSRYGYDISTLISKIYEVCEFGIMDFSRFLLILLDFFSLLKN